MKLPHVPENPPAEERPPMSRRTLLQKYEIPIDHLDFKYVRECLDAKMVERILRILRSGEEGFFPDLQMCTETRLRELNPRSKLLREEVPVLRADSLPAGERKQLQGDIEDWAKDIADKNRLLRAETVGTQQSVKIPQIRETKNAAAKEDRKSLEEQKKVERIRSCDYDQWDKYDADTELTKLDLTEERNREASEAADKKKAKVIDQLMNEAAKDLAKQATQMNVVERDLCANRFRVQGNEHYNAGDYAEAVAEYTRSLTVQRTAVVLANRAMAYLKLQENAKALRDCDESLQIDGSNVKVLLRKAHALTNEDRRIEALRVYNEVLKIDPNNVIAEKSVKTLRKIVGDLPPENAFRMKIEDNSQSSVPKKSSETKPKNTKNSKPAKESVPDDLAQLIIPKKIVPSKLASMAQTMGSLKNSAINPKLPNVSSGAASPQTKKPPSTHAKSPINIKMPYATKNPNKTTRYNNGVIIEEL